MWVKEHCNVIKKLGTALKNNKLQHAVKEQVLNFTDIVTCNEHRKKHHRILQKLNIESMEPYL